LHWSTELKVGDGHWVLVAAPIPDGPGSADHLGSWLILIGGLLATLIVIAYFWTTRRNAERLRLGNRQLDQANVALDIANERLLTQNARFDTALNNMSQGLCFFDGAQRLIVCNSRYIEMYGLDPNRVRSGTPLAEIVDLRFEAGSFPAMSREEYLAWRNNVVVSDQPCDFHGGAEGRPCLSDPSSADARQGLGRHPRRHHRATARRGCGCRSATQGGARPAGGPGRPRAPARGVRGGARRNRVDGRRRPVRHVEQPLCGNVRG